MKPPARYFFCGERNLADVWFIDKPRVNDLHPTMKPVQLVEQAILHSSKSGDLVLDPFSGSGSTLIACQKTSRCGRLIELDPRYVDVAILRWEAFSIIGMPTRRARSNCQIAIVPERLALICRSSEW